MTTVINQKLLEKSEIFKIKDFSSIDIDYSWSFSDKTIKDTAYITHNYYTYPAKFIPQLVSRLINTYTNKYDIVVDPFMGSGTTAIAAIKNNRNFVGYEINKEYINLANNRILNLKINAERFLF